jgi:predicted Zn finger-like uncharacterized protein
MRVQCPDCTIAYDVPEHLLAGRKVLRCARCGAEWVPGAAQASEPVQTTSAPPVQAAVPDTPAHAPVPPPVDTAPLAPSPREEEPERPPFSAMQRLARPVEPPPRTPWVGMAWVGSLIVLAALAWGALTWRADIMHAWPPSTRAYAAIGLAPTSP